MQNNKDTDIILHMHGFKVWFSKLTQYHLFLVLIIVFHIVLNIAWHSVNNAPPTWDSAGHLGLSFLFADKIPSLLFGEISFTNFLRISNYYPPLVQLLGGFSIIMFGRSYFSAIYIGTVFLVISIIYLYKILMHYFNDQKLTSYAIFVYSMFPHVWEQSRQFHLDVPLVALLLMSYYYLIKSDSLKNHKNSILFFLLLTLVQLTKWYGFVFLIVPLIYEVAVKALRQRDLLNKSRFANILQGSVIVLVLALPWYIANYSNIAEIVSITSQGEVGDPENVWSFESLFHYLKLIMSHQITFVSVMLLFFSIYMFSKRNVQFKDQIFNMMLFPYAVFTLIQNKDLRYVLPLTPIFALYIGYTLFKLVFRGDRFIRTLFFIYLMLIYFFMSFNQFTKLPDRFMPLAYVIGGPYYHGWYYEPYSYAANTGDWLNDRIIREINEYAKTEPMTSDRYRVLELSDNRYYSLASFEMFRRQNSFEKMEIVVPYFQFNPFTPQELDEYLLNIHFALVPDNPGPSGLRNIAVLNQLRDYFLQGTSPDFTLVKKYEMPDGNVLSLYKRTNFISYKASSVREDSLKIFVGNILFLDRNKTEGLPFNVYLYDSDGAETLVEVIGGGSQRRIRLEGVSKFRVDLPIEQQDVRDLRGWNFEDGVFTIDSNFKNIVLESGNEYIYENLKTTPRSKYIAQTFEPKSIARFMESENQEGLVEKSILVSVEHPDKGDKVYVAYATEGWVWDGIWLEGDVRYVEIPVDGLLQLEVSQRSQLIVGFPLDWGFFPCYDGDAICYYPVVEGL